MCDFCNTPHYGWKVELKDKTISICANHLAYWGARLVNATFDNKDLDFPKLIGNKTCEINGTTDAIRISSEYPNAQDETYTLNPSTFTRFICHDLKPNEYLALIRNGHSKYDYMLHDDFYSDNGWAYQPIR